MVSGFIKQADFKVNEKRGALSKAHEMIHSWKQYGIFIAL